MISFQEAQYLNSMYNFFTVLKAVTYSSLYQPNSWRGTPTTKPWENKTLFSMGYFLLKNDATN